jgi:hypothetical protein
MPHPPDTCVKGGSHGEERNVGLDMPLTGPPTYTSLGPTRADMPTDRHMVGRERQNDDKHVG